MRTFATNSLFGTFFLSAFGWGMLQTWAAGVGASGILHALIAVPCLSMIGVVFYRYRRHWPSSQPLRKEQRTGSRQLLAYSTLIWCSTLAVAEIGIGAAVSWGSISVILLAVMAVVAVPWTRIPVCREHFFVATATLGVGAGAGLVLFAKRLYPFYYPFAGSAILLTSCCVVLFMLTTHGNRLDRMPESGY
jgi:hypothetical protein